MFLFIYIRYLYTLSYNKDYKILIIFLKKFLISILNNFFEAILTKIIIV